VSLCVCVCVCVCCDVKSTVGARLTVQVEKFTHILSCVRHVQLADQSELEGQEGQHKTGVEWSPSSCEVCGVVR